MTILQYCTRLKSLADQLRDLGQPVTAGDCAASTVSIMLRSRSAAAARSFLQVRSFLMLKETSCGAGLVSAGRSRALRPTAHHLAKAKPPIDAGGSSSSSPPAPPTVRSAVPVRLRRRASKLWLSTQGPRSSACLAPSSSHFYFFSSWER
jgi:hypothetical protein